MSGTSNQNPPWTRNRRRLEQRKRRKARLAIEQSRNEASGSEITPESEPTEGGIGALPKTALFEREHGTREDVRLARMAIRKRWQPEAAQTHAVLNKATEIAMRDSAPAGTVIAVAKLHLDAHRQVQSDEHHDDRLEYHERALQIRSKVGDYIPSGSSQIGIHVASGGNLQIVLPHNGRDDGMVDEAEPAG